MPTKLVHNIETGVVAEIELTAEEVLQSKKDVAQKAVEAESVSKQALAKEELLARLGITADEAELLLA